MGVLERAVMVGKKAVLFVFAFGLFLIARRYDGAMWGDV